MRSSTFSSILACVAVATAQSSPSAPYDIGNYFPVIYNDSVTVQPGMLFDSYQAAKQPSFSLASDATVNQPFVVIMIDPDVVVNASTGIKSILLHMMQPNLYASNSSSQSLTFNRSGPNASSVVGAPYLSPAPPIGAPHNYNFFLFRQPVNFTMPPNFTRFNPPSDILARTYFNITEFAAVSGLGQPIAANYLRVINGTVVMASAYATQTATSGVAFPSGFSFSSPAGATSTSTPQSSSSSIPSSTSAAIGLETDVSHVFKILWATIAALLLF